MKKTLLFHPPVNCLTAGKSSPETFDRSIEAFENRKYETSLRYLLDSVCPGVRTPSNTVARGEYTIPHGPLRIGIKLEKDRLSITAPLVSLTTSGKVAMLRQAAALNFNDLDLVRLVPEGEGLTFKFSCPLIYSHPQKIKRVLEEICRTGEKYDYEFIDQFEAERLSSPCFIPYAPEKVRYVYDAVQSACKECLDAVSYFENSRKFSEECNLIRATLLKLFYVAQPQGKLRHTLTKAIDDMDRNMPLQELNADAKETLRQLQEESLEELSASLYAVHTFVPDKKSSNLQKLRERYESCYKQAAAWMEAGEYRKVCLRLTGEIYDTYYRYYVDSQLDSLFSDALKETSAQPWVAAAPRLFELFDNIMQGRIKKDHAPAAA